MVFKRTQARLLGRYRRPSKSSPFETLEARTLFAAVSASLANVPDVTDPTALSVQVQVSYSPTRSLGQFSLDDHDLVVTGPNSFQGTVVLARIDAAADISQPTIATYEIIAPGGRFDTSDNGVYTVALASDQVFDAFQESIPGGTLGTFNVTVPQPPSVPITAPTDVLDTDFLVEASAYQPDGKLLLTGSESVAYLGPPDFEGISAILKTRQEVIRRYNVDGTIDTSFGGGDGKIEAGLTGQYSAAYGIFVQPNDGKIVIASGQSSGQQYNGAEFVLRRFNADGSTDLGFQGNNGVSQPGEASFHFTSYFDNEAGKTVSAEAIPYALAFQPDGKIIVAGHTVIQRSDGSFDKDFALCRLNANGTFDDGSAEDSTPGDRFGPGINGATAITDLSGANDSIGSMILMPDGSIYVAGVADGNAATGDGHAAIAKYTPGGLLDTSFNGTGFKILTSLYTEADDFTVGLSARSNGDIVVAARTLDKSNFALTRIRSNGSVDTGFGSGGIATADFGGIDDADRVVSLPNGKILVAGTSAVTNGSGKTVSTAIASFNANGTVDTFFGPGGDTGTGNGKQTYDSVTTSTASGIIASAASVRKISLGEKFIRASLGLNNKGDAVVGRNTNDDESKFRILKADRTSPTAVLSPVAAVTQAGGASISIVVNYTDDQILNGGSITAPDLTIVGPLGSFSPTSVTTTGVRSSFAATYIIPAPGGSWDTSDNGSYVISLNANEVVDSSNNAVAAATLGTFQANVPTPGAGPSAAFVPVTDVASGATTTFNIAYTDDGSVNLASIDPADVIVTGPGGTLTVVSGFGAASGTNAVGTYTVSAPGGSWDSTESGTYTVSLVAGQVLDNEGKSANAGTLGTFIVVASAPPAPVEPTGPLEGTLSISNPASAVGGQKAKVKAKIVITNRSADTVEGISIFRLVLSSDAAVDATDATVSILSKKVKLKAGKSKNFSFKIGVLPAVVSGTYQFLASVDAPSGASDWAAGPSIVMAAPFVDLATSPSTVSPTTAKPGKSIKINLPVTNLGNIEFKGKPAVSVSIIPAAGGTPISLGTANVSIKLSAGKSKKYSPKFKLPEGLTPGSYIVTAVVDPTASLAESSRDNNTSTSTLVIGS